MRASLCCAIALMIGAADAAAQEAPATTTPELSVLEEIVVTARRRTETLQSVPVSVSAFSEDRLKELQAENITGIQHSVPNLYLDQGDASNAVIFLRGIGQNDSLAFVEPGVSVYVDDVYIARTQAAFLELFDVERVEVLRGPQGTLYGRNSPGGAVKLVTREPTDELDVYLEAGAGRFSSYQMNGRASGPLADDLKGKIAFSLRNRNGFSKNTFKGGRDGDTSFAAWRASLLYEPRDDFRVSFAFEGKVDRPNTSRSPVRKTPLVAFADPFNDPFTPTVFQPNEDNFEVETNANDFSDLTTYGFSLKAEWDISPDWSLELISSYREFDFDLELDTDGSPLPVLDVVLFQDQEQFTEELRASYDAGRRLTFTGGLFYFHDFDLTLSGFDALAAGLPAFGLPLALFAPGSQLADTNQRTDSFAVYGDATFAITDRLKLEAGLRYTYDEKRSRRRFELFDPDILIAEEFPPFLAGVGTPLQRITGKKDFDAFTPRIVLSYDVLEEAMVYGSVSRGFKSGGFDGRAATDFAFQPFGPESVWAFEGGAKTSWFGGRLTANAAYFYNRYRDLQVTSFGRDAITGFFQSLFTNAAAAKIQGVELELAARPLDGLSINATVGFLDADYKKFETLVNGLPTDVSDRDLINSPKWNASLGATYEQPVAGDFVVTLHADGAYRGDVANEITDSPNLREDEYVILNAFVSLKTADERWEFRLGGTNLTDREIKVQGFNLSEFPGVETAFFGPRRQYDARLVFRY